MLAQNCIFVSKMKAKMLVKDADAFDVTFLESCGTLQEVVSVNNSAYEGYNEN